MEIIELDDLVYGKVIGYGAYGYVHEALLGMDLYALKLFDIDEPYFDITMAKKLESVALIGLEHSLLPKFFVKKQGKLVGYLTPLVSHHDLSFVDTYELDRRIIELKKVKTYIEEIHSHGVVHCDLHTGNVLFRDGFLIDFDNCAYKDYGFDFDFLSDDAQEYLNKFGLCKELDIYIFNRVCFRLINGIPRDASDDHIAHKMYGIFDKPDARKICDSLLVENEIFNGDYLIDTINASKRERSLK